MNRQQILEYYAREDISKALIEHSKEREAVGTFFDGTYEKRPNIIQYPNDIVQMVRKGVVSFHFSVERWKNAMSVNSQNYSEMRSGWDFVLDIDSKLGIEESKTAAMLICRTLEKYGVRNYGIKFSGRRGFHISVGWEAFPKEVDYKPLARMYPEAPRILARFIRKKISKVLMRKLVKRRSAKELIEALGEAPSRLSPFYFVEVEKDWGARHLFRAPYSLNEKTWLASLPIARQHLKRFEPEIAQPKKVNVKEKFFVSEENEAEDLLLEALDWHAMHTKQEKKQEPKRLVVYDKKIPEEFFPPCVKTILAGMSEGRKRSIFTLVTFLKMMNWQPEEIEQSVLEWNERNKPPLPRSILLSQMRWNLLNDRKPPNCTNETFCRSIGLYDICSKTVDHEKMKIKNPIAYPYKIMKERRKLRQDLKAVKRGFSCGVCNKEFPTMRSLAQHKGRVH
ncbi:MAG: hypothetical protein HYW26_01115 [Candidatus Aenigmarchaeota archaeon]|nr:hypothetical protein [Candidatus Aenigmarchaeota archaeon]